MIIKVPTSKAEEGRKSQSPSVRPSERASILLELVEALRLNGELVRNARAGDWAQWIKSLL
jgi:hypothetical protein